MKKLIITLIAVVLILGCKKTPFVEIPQPPTPNSLEITSKVGIKLESSFVTSEVAMNVKSDVAQTVTIKIFNIGYKVVSKETVNVKVGDNILKVYTNALPSSAYRIGLYDQNDKELGITDFNKL